jgi:Bacterial Ig-like domain (group 3)/FG-GAP-like repeat
LRLIHLKEVSMTSPRIKTTRILTPSVLILALVTVLISSAAPAAAQNPVPFIDQPLVPDATAPGGAGFTLTVNGAGFVATSTVNWNGSPRATTFVSSHRLTATILTSDITTASTAAVTVVNPIPGGGISNSQFFSITVAGTSFSFLPAALYNSIKYSTYFSVVIADVNGDGKPDIIVSSQVNNSTFIGSLEVFLGNGDGTFQPPVSYDSGGSNPYSVAVGDVNGDGTPDLVVANGCASGTYGIFCSSQGVLGVLLGNGDGTFQAPLTFDSGGSCLNGSQAAVADMNGDGKLDLVVTNFNSSTVGVLLGNGDGTFQPAVTYPSGGYKISSAAVADINHDGILDVLAANWCVSAAACVPGQPSLGVVGVLLGNGNGTFQPAVTYDSGGDYAVSVAVADVNSDGSPDLLVGNCGADECGNFISGTVDVLLGNGDGTFKPAVTYNSGGNEVNSVALADVNGDGKLDLLVANWDSGDGANGVLGDGTVGILLGNGNGTFQPAVPYDSGAAYSISVAVADLNGDGRPDAVVANFCSNGALDCIASAESSVGVFLNNTGSAHISFATSTALASGLNPSIYGQAITLTATVTSIGGRIPPHPETVTFYNGLSVLGTAPMTGGIASLTTSSLQSGIHAITAAYLGDANFTASTSPVLQQVVDSSSQSATTTALASSLDPSIYGQKVTWTATVTTSGKTTPTGKVNFNWGSYSIGTATLNASGVATLTRPNLSADAYPLFAVYVGDANNGASASAILNQVITQTTSSATLTSSPNSSTEGQSVTFTAKITSPTTTPTGPVTFTAGKTTLGTVELKGGKATLTTSTLAVGSTTVTVTYPWNSDIAESSASVTQVVDQ